jgi:hypothetical protein
VVGYSAAGIPAAAKKAEYTVSLGQPDNPVTRLCYHAGELQAWYVLGTARGGRITAFPLQSIRPVECGGFYVYEYIFRARDRVIDFYNLEDVGATGFGDYGCAHFQFLLNRRNVCARACV